MNGQPVQVQFLRLAHGVDLDPPSYQSAGAAGLDLVCALPAAEPVTIMPGARALIPTGFSMELPDGFEAQVRPRSGLALKNGVTVLNAPGTIDCDYRGEIKALLANFGDAPWTAERGARIAQLVIAPVTRAKIELVASLSDTDRGAGGFGSTGTNVSSNPKRR